MPEADLLTILEAARWAPSAFNVQPWRFVYSRRDDSTWSSFYSLLDDFNGSWAHGASALVFLFSDKEVDGVKENGTIPNAFHSFDAGTAWGQAALQASLLGYHAHAVAGLARDRVHETLGVPGRYKAEVAILIGRRGPVGALSSELQKQERPSERKSLNEIAFQGAFNAPEFA
ncbi:nitroreductase family protein [Roseibium denhamense]